MVRSMVSDSKIIKLRTHYFIGSGIPKHDTLKVERLDGLEFTVDPILEKYLEKDSIIIKTEVTNKFAGHRVPTGDPERFIITELSVYNIEKDRVVSIDSFRIGEQWEWYPEAKKISDNNLDPGESRMYQMKLKLSKGNYQLD